MYYSYQCTYCGRLFYTFSESKEAASHILYRAIKQHLIDYNEDDKEHEMDDGEEMDSDQIYYHMSELSDRPIGGYEATDAQPGSSDYSSGVDTGFTKFLFYLILVILIVGALLFFFFGGSLPLSLLGISFH